MRLRHRGVAALTVVAAWALGAAWLGCNALLGNESAVFEPDSGAGADGANPGADGPLGDAPTADAAGDASVDAPIVHPCGSTQTDTFNCGSCGHDCFGGVCSLGHCQPVTIASDPGAPAEIAVDSTHVYWTNTTTGAVRRVPIGGGAAETVFVGTGARTLAQGLVRSGTDVYFALDDVDGGVFKCPATGCGAAPPQPVIAPMASPGFVGLAPGGVLLVSEDAFDGRVGRCTLPCAGGLTFLTAGESFPSFVAAEGESVYWSNLIPGPGNLRAKIDNASAPVTLVPGETALQVAVNGPEVLFAVRGSGVRSVPRDGGTERRIYEPLTQTERFALDGTDVYFNDTSTTAGRILKCPLVGCGDAGATIASGQTSPNAIAVDKTSIYWTNVGDGNSGTVMRLAK